MQKSTLTRVYLTLTEHSLTGVDSDIVESTLTFFLGLEQKKCPYCSVRIVLTSEPKLHLIGLNWNGNGPGDVIRPR